MPEIKRTTIYLEKKLYQALKIHATVSDSGISEWVNDAIRERLREDAEDARLLRKRSKQATRPFSEFVRELKRERLL